MTISKWELFIMIVCACTTAITIIWAIDEAYIFFIKKFLKKERKKSMEEITLDIKVNSDEAVLKLKELERTVYNLEQRIKKIQ